MTGHGIVAVVSGYRLMKVADYRDKETHQDILTLSSKSHLRHKYEHPRHA